MSNADNFPEEPEISPAVMIRRALFLVLLISLSFFYLMLDFRGLSHPMGMDQAQISREVARGHGFSTKTIRPVALYQINKARDADGEAGVALAGFQDTYHAPLNPLFNSILLWMGKSSWDYDGETPVYALDFYIAAGSMVLLLCSIGVSYLLVARIFDARIAGVMAFLLLLCELLWKFSQTGLPQMLMLFLFSFALYFIYKAIENLQQERPAYLWAAMAGGFFGLLALAHWITVWMFVGLLVFAALYFRPRGVLAVLMFGVFALIVSIWLIRNTTVCGDPAGAAKFVFFSGLGEQTEGMVMRNWDPESEPFSMEGLFSRTMGTSLAQLNDLYRYLGAIVVAPLFFLSLLHPFKRREIADFRWCILLMWVFATIGMSIFGLADGALDANQIHVLFIPIMTAYGLAFLSILWNRLALPLDIPMVRYGHFTLAIIISAMPLMLTLPTDIKRGMLMKDAKVNYPPYYPPLIKRITESAKEHEVVVSDMPWAVAWYGDRISLWLPRKVDQFDELFTYSSDKNQPMAGLLLTPVSTDARMAREIVSGEYADWAPLIIRGGFAAAQKAEGESFEAFPFTATPGQLFRNNEIVWYTEPERVPR